MIKGIGVDIIEIKRIDNLINRYGNKFLYRIFTDLEIRYANKRSNAESFAGMFAAKEAFVKAANIRKIEFKEIEILHDKDNKPFYNVKVKTFNSCKLSISHNKTNAVAICIIE